MRDTDERPVARNDSAAMKSQDEDDDGDDPIKLNYDENASRLEFVQFLDPGIIELDCDSDEDLKYIDEDIISDSNLPGEDRVIVKPMCIKLVDCYKFPWYFDQLTKDIIQNSLIINNSVNNSISEQITDIGSNEFRNVPDKLIYEVDDDGTDCKGTSVNKISSETQELNNGKDIFLNKAIDINQVRAPSCNKLRVTNHSKRLRNTIKRNEMELLKAMSQRNKTGIDIKKNTGLVGLKVKHMSTERQTSGFKCKPKNKIGIINKETNNLYVQAVDKALTNLGTMMIPIFKETEENTKYSDLNKPAVSQNKIDIILPNPKNLESCENEVDYKYNNILARKSDMLSKISKNTQIAEEIVRIISSERKELKETQKNSNEEVIKKYELMPYSKKIEMKKKKRLLHGNQNSLRRQTELKDSQMNKIKTKIPLCSKERNKKTQLKSTSTYEVREPTSSIPFFSSVPENYTPGITSTKADIPNHKHTKSHDVKKQERGKSKSAKVVPSEINSPIQRSDTVVPNISFSILNKLTENLQARRLQQCQIKKNSKLHQKRTKSLGKPKSKDECKSIPSALTPESNVNKKLSKSELDTQLLDSNKSKNSYTSHISPKTSLAQIQYFNNNKPGNCPKTKQSHLASHNAQFRHHNEPSTLPLNTIIMKTAKTDHTTMKERSSVTTGTTRLQKLESLEGIESIEEKIKTKENTKQPNGSPQPLLNIDTPAAKDQFTIQTVITTQNELNVANRTPKKTVDNVTYQTHVPKTQTSEIRLTQIQKHLDEANKHLAGSMQSHILYRPQAENFLPRTFLNNMEVLRHQTPMQQMNQPVCQPPVNPTWYPSWYSKKIAPNTTPMIRRIPNEFNAGIPAQTSNTGQISSGNNEQIMNLRHVRVDEGFPPQVEMNIRYNVGILPHVNINDIAMPAGANRAVSNEMNARSVVNKRVPTQMTFDSRPMPPGVSNVQPKTVFWSYAFPPPKAPPPPPPFLRSKENTAFPISLQTPSSSIIGRNNDGIIKKINITAPVFDHSTEIDNKEGIVKADSTPFYDKIPPVAPENDKLAITKSEMLRILDISMQRIKSPVKHAESTLSIFSSTDLEQPLTIQSKSIPSDLQHLKKRNILKKVQPIPFESNKNNCVDHELLPHNTSGKATIKRMTMDLEPNINQSKSPHVTPNRPFDTNNSTSPSRLIEDNPKPAHNMKRVKSVNTDEPRLSQAINSKVLQIESTEVYSSHKKSKPCKFETNARPVINFQKTDGARPVNLKRTLPLNQTKNTSSGSKCKPGPLSKKIKLNDPSSIPIETKIIHEILPNVGYSPPILPIPTYQKFLSEISAPCNKHFDGPIDPSRDKKPFDKDDKVKILNNMNPNKPTKKLIEEKSNKTDKAKKISLDEYKKRSAGERKTDKKACNKFQSESLKKNAVEMARRASNVDSDLGYDSDSTIMLAIL